MRALARITADRAEADAWLSQARRTGRNQVIGPQLYELVPESQGS